MPTFKHHANPRLTWLDPSKDDAPEDMGTRVLTLH